VHKSVMDYLKRSIDPLEVCGRRVLEIGSLITDDSRGSAREIIEPMWPALYLGIDMRTGPGVDIQLRIEDLLVRFEPEWFDVILCAEVLEHVQDWRFAVNAIKKLLYPGGRAFVTTRSHGFWYHPEPEDYWRFSCNDFRRMFADMAIVLEPDPDYPGVFMKAIKRICRPPFVNLDRIHVSPVHGPGHYRSVISYTGPEPAPKFTIITPTVLRPSLARACRSVDHQRYKNWEHLVVIDIPGATLPKELEHPKRFPIICSRAHKNWGTTCRHNAVLWATGHYIVYLDDDNFYDPRALLLLAENLFLKKFPDWGVFPMRRLGVRFFSADPGLGQTDTSQFFHRIIVRGERIRFEDTEYHAADGLLVEHLKTLSAPAMIDPGLDLVHMPIRSWGAGEIGAADPCGQFCVVIPNKYDDVIRPLVESIRQFEFSSTRVLIVADHHERDYGFELVRTASPDAFVFARQCNVGIREAGRADVMLVNDDIRLMRFNTFATMWRVAQENPDVGILSALIDGGVGNQKQQAQNNHHWSGGDGLVYCSGFGEDYLCFPFVFLRRKMLDEIGLLDERFIHYGKDDADLCRRAVLAGWKLGITKDAVVCHGRGGDSNVAGVNFSLSFARHPELIGGKDPFDEKWAARSK